MKMSEKKRSEVYNAINTPIQNLRMKYIRNRMVGQDVDGDLFALNNEIWRAVHKALNLEGPP